MIKTYDKRGNKYLNINNRFEVTYNSLKELDCYDAYHTVIGFLETKIKKAVYLGDLQKHKLDYFYNKDCEQFIAVVDDSIYINAIVDKSVLIKQEPLFEDEISQEEWKELFDNEPALQYSPRPYEYSYKCELSLFASDKTSGFNLAIDIINKLFSDILKDNLILGKDDNNLSSHWNPVWYVKIIN